ncbi:hypothetical protein SPHINGOT1_260249 [Sphingomonas sp. T1]|nr:hypothetical protein SPHINGOT1_260249 [Sphingomonas sp. T1]
MPFTAGPCLAVWPRREAGNPGAPRAIRTPDPQIRSLMLYPAELWVHWRGADSRHFSRRKGVAR